MKNIGGITKLFFALIIMIGLAGAGAALSKDGGGSWQYYKNITISNTGGILTDYQVFVALSGTDFPINARSDGADIRFTDASGSELNYWIESWIAGSADIWVKVPNIPTGAVTTIRMYYGNPSASSSNSGDGTFIFFDDFDGASLNTNKWTDVPGGSGNYSIANGKLILIAISGDYKAIKTQSTFSSQNIAYVAKAYSSGNGGGGGTFYITNYSPQGNPWFNTKWYRITDDRNGATMIKQISRYFDSDANQVELYREPGMFSSSTKLEQRIGESKIDFLWDGMQKYSEQSQFVTTDKITITLFEWYQGITYWDWIFVRQYSSLEPTVSTGTEQIMPGSIFITSSPSGAEILINNQSKGTASPTLTVAGISPGSYAVRCKLSGYLDYDSNVVLTAGNVAYINCALNPAPIYTPTATSTPTTPIPTTPAPTSTQTFTPTLTSKPTPTTGSLSVSSTPTGASIYLDTVYKGETPKIITDVSAGIHQIELKLQDYETWVGSINVDAGNTSPVPVSVLLSPATPTITTPVPTTTIHPPQEWNLVGILIVVLVISVPVAIFVFRRITGKSKGEQKQVTQKLLKCPKCGGKISEDDDFCGMCGKKLKS